MKSGAENPIYGTYNPGQKCWEGSITLEITPSPFSMLDFSGTIW